MLKFFMIVALFFQSLSASAFTLISGANEAKLPVSPENPEIIFYWDGSAPTIEKKEEFDGGRFEDMDDEDFMEKMLGEAFGIWNDVKGSYLNMTVEKDPDIGLDSDDLKFGIVTKSTGSFSTAAAALPILNDDANEIEDCDIMMGKNTVTAKDLAYILAHEIGHCVGLGHNHSNRLAMMGYTRGDRNLYLSNDDKAGLIYLYMDPAYKTERKEFLGCAVVGAQTHSPGFLVLMGLAPLLVALAFSQIRRQRALAGF